MLDVQRFDDANTFLTGTEEHLVAHEAENNLLFGLAHAIAKGLYGDPLLVAVRSEGRVALAALMTPPHNLVLSTSDDVTPVRFLARWLRDSGVHIPGASGPAENARAFVQEWEPTARHMMAQRIYKLERVRAPRGVPGSARPAAARDADLIARWLIAFSNDAVEEELSRDAAAALADEWIRGDDRGLLIWEDGEPVSMAGFTGPTPNGIRIGAVYTPPDRRRRGYASACTAAVSGRMLESGRRFCFLYTDLANPTSNHIYAEIGYEPVCDVDVYRFQE